ncbi:MAG TPA: tetratricopeptide repeat protein [Spirochaetota bacterium]|nr:tetratricopeptide repeat protein [Spirochaetota bacterium]
MEPMMTGLIWEDLACEPLVWDVAMTEFHRITLDGETVPGGPSDGSLADGTAPVMEDQPGSESAKTDDRESFVHGIARWTQLEMESMFLREVSRSLSFPLRVNTLVKLPNGRLPRVIERLVPRLESFVQHGYSLRRDTIAAMLKVFLVAGEDERARRLAESLSSQVDSAEIRYYHGLALFRLSLHDQACAQAKRAVSMDPASAISHLLLAACQIKTGEVHEAGRTLAGALPLFARDEAVLRFAIPWIRKTGDEDALVQVLSSVTDLRPDDVESQLVLADILYRRGQFGSICEQYGKYRDSLDRARLCRYGICLASLGREQEALEIFSSLLSHQPDHPDLWSVVQALYDSGLRDAGLVRLIAQRLMDCGRVEECLELCSRHADLAGGDPGLVFLQVQCYTQRGSYEKALALLGNMPAGSSASEDERAYLTGYLLFLLGKREEAVPWLESGCRMPGREVAALRMLGEIAVHSGDHHKAAGIYRKLSRLLRDDAGVLARAAWSSMQAGMVSLAIEGFRDLVRVLPDCPEGWNNLGVLLARSGQFEEAARAFKTSLRLDPDQPEAGKNLALVYDRVLRSKSAEYLERFADGELSTAGGD